MLKLLKGSFIRLFKSSEFQLIPFLLIIANTVIIMTRHNLFSDMVGSAGTDEGTVVFHLMYINICSAVFVALFVGTEYSNATVFNKIIFGHSRTTVFLTYLITCLFAAAFFHLAATAVTTLIGLVVLGEPLFTLSTLMHHYLLSLPPIFAGVSLHLMITVIAQNRSVGTAVSSALSTVLLFVSYYLCQPEKLGNKLFDFLSDFYLYKLTAREWLIESKIIEELNFPLYPSLLFIVFTIAGLIIFNNINIRNTPEGEV